MTDITFERVVLVCDVFVQMFRKFTTFEEFDAADIANVQTNIMQFFHMSRNSAGIGTKFIFNAADQTRVYILITRDHLEHKKTMIQSCA